MMKTVAKGGVPQVPGMGPIPGASYGGKKKVQPRRRVEVGQPGQARGRECGARGRRGVQAGRFGGRKRSGLGR